MENPLLKLRSMMEKPAMELTHKFRESFQNVAEAYWSKYKKPNSWNRVTILNVRTIEDGKFMVTRRHDTFAENHYVYEHVTFDQKHKEIETFMRSEKKDFVLTHYVEHCHYKEIQDTSQTLETPVDDSKTRTNMIQTQYTMQLFKDPGYKRFIRAKIFNWGVENMTKRIEKNKRKSINPSFFTNPLDHLREKHLKFENQVKQMLANKRSKLSKDEIQQLKDLEKDAKTMTLLLQLLNEQHQREITSIKPEGKDDREGKVVENSIEYVNRLMRLQHNM